MSAHPVHTPLIATDLRSAPRIALYGLWAGPFPLRPLQLSVALLLRSRERIPPGPSLVDDVFFRLVSCFPRVHRQPDRLHRNVRPRCVRLPSSKSWSLRRRSFICLGRSHASAVIRGGNSRRLPERCGERVRTAKTYRPTDFRHRACSVCQQ